jgi:hypothetical protein
MLLQYNMLTVLLLTLSYGTASAGLFASLRGIPVWRTEARPDPPDATTYRTY